MYLSAKPVEKWLLGIKIVLHCQIYKPIKPYSLVLLLYMTPNELEEGHSVEHLACHYRPQV